MFSSLLHLRYCSFINSFWLLPDQNQGLKDTFYVLFTRKILVDIEFMKVLKLRSFLKKGKIKHTKRGESNFSFIKSERHPSIPVLNYESVSWLNRRHRMNRWNIKSYRKLTEYVQIHYKIHKNCKFERISKNFYSFYYLNPHLTNYFNSIKVYKENNSLH